MRCVTIANTNIQVIEYNGKRVMTSAQVNQLFGDKQFIMNNRKTAKNRSNDFIHLDKQNAKEFAEANDLPPVKGGRGIVLWGEGIVKVFADMACKSSVMKELDDKYFHSNDVQTTEQTVIGQPLLLVEEEPLHVETVDEIGVDEDGMVDGRRLHAFLQVNERYNDWFQRMCEYGFVERVDFLRKKAGSTGGRPAIEYELTINMAKEISMIQRNKRGKQARQYLLYSVM